MFETDTALKSGTASFDVATGVGGSGIGYTDTATDGSLTGFFDPEIFHLVTNTKAFVIDTNSGSFGFKLTPARGARNAADRSVWIVSGRYSEAGARRRPPRKVDR